MPNMKSQFAKADYFDFSRGIVRGISQYKSRPNFVKKASNVIFRPAKAMRVRGGYRAANQALCAEVPTSLAKYYTTTNDNFIFVGTDSSDGLELTGELQRATLAAYFNQLCFDELNLPISLTGKRWRFAQINGCEIGTQDGATYKPIFFRAEATYPNAADTWISCHMTKPLTAPTAVLSVGGGVDEGTHFYRVRWRYFNGASEASPSLKIFGGPTVINGSVPGAGVILNATVAGSFLGLLPGMNITAGPAGPVYPLVIATVAPTGNSLTVTVPFVGAIAAANWTFNWVGASNTVSLGNIPINPAGRTDYIGWTLERTKADNIGGESGKWYVVADGTLANYVDTVPDNLLFTEVDEGVYGQVPEVDGIIGFKNRMVAWRGTNIYVSEPVGGTDGTGIFNFDPLNYYPVEKDDGDKIQTIILQADRLLVFKKRAVFAFEGEDENSFRVVAVYDGAGAAGIRCAASYGNAAIFYSGEAGIFKVEGNNVTPFGWLEVGDYKEDFDVQKRDRTQVFNYLGEYIITVYKAKDKEFPEDCLVFDLRYGNWTHWDNMRIADVVVSKDISDFTGAQFLYVDPKEFDGGSAAVNIDKPSYHAHRFSAASPILGSGGLHLTKFDTLTNTIAWDVTVSSFLSSEPDFLCHTIVSCPDGTVNIFWNEVRAPDGNTSTNTIGETLSIWGQKYDLNGTAQWTAGGVKISEHPTAANNKETYGLITAVGDGLGGSVVGYGKFLNGSGSATMYVRRIVNAGTLPWSQIQLANAPTNMPQGMYLFHNDVDGVNTFVMSECGGAFGRKWFANKITDVGVKRWDNAYGGRAVHPSTYTATPNFFAIYNDPMVEEGYYNVFNKAQRPICRLDEEKYAVMMTYPIDVSKPSPGTVGVDQFKVRYFDVAALDADFTAAYATTTIIGQGLADNIYETYTYRPPALTPDGNGGCWATYAYSTQYPNNLTAGIKAVKFNASGALEYSPVNVVSSTKPPGFNNADYLDCYGMQDGEGGIYCIYTQEAVPFTIGAPYFMSVTKLDSNGIYDWSPAAISFPLVPVGFTPDQSFNRIHNINSFPTSDGAGGLIVYYMGAHGFNPTYYYFNAYLVPSSGPGSQQSFNIVPPQAYGVSGPTTTTNFPVAPVTVPTGLQIQTVVGGTVNGVLGDNNDATYVQSDALNAGVPRSNMVVIDPPPVDPNTVTSITITYRASVTSPTPSSRQTFVHFSDNTLSPYNSLASDSKDISQFQAGAIAAGGATGTEVTNYSFTLSGPSLTAWKNGWNSIPGYKNGFVILFVDNFAPGILATIHRVQVTFTHAAPIQPALISGVGDWASYNKSKALEHLTIDSGFKLQSGLDGFGDERDHTGAGGDLTRVIVEFHDSDDGFPDYLKDYDRVCIHVRGTTEFNASQFHMTATIDTLEDGGLDAVVFSIDQFGSNWDLPSSTVHTLWNQFLWGGSILSVLESGWKNGTVGRRYKLTLSAEIGTDVTIEGFTMDSFMLPERSYSR